MVVHFIPIFTVFPQSLQKPGVLFFSPPALINTAKIASRLTILLATGFFETFFLSLSCPFRAF